MATTKKTEGQEVKVKPKTRPELVKEVEEINLRILEIETEKALLIKRLDQRDKELNMLNEDFIKCTKSLIDAQIKISALDDTNYKLKLMIDDYNELSWFQKIFVDKI